jgi:hypothetical protein
MAYTKEMQLFLLQNPDVIETGSLTDAVEAAIFKAIHERIEQKLQRRPWSFHFDILNHGEDSYGETLFAPILWPKRKDGSYQAYYRIREYGENNVYCPILGGLKPPALVGSFSVSCLT